jgi:uncharacterized membrane protein
MVSGWLPNVDRDRVVAAVEAFERQTSGEIVVSISHLFWGNVERAARRAFDRLGIANTRLRNGVLLFVVPARHRLVILGDTAIDAKVAPGFWARAAASTAAHIAPGELTSGLLHGIQLIGAELAAHFPPAEGDTNELPDVIDVR